MSVTTTTSAAPVTVWHGCYEQGWRDLIVPEAFAHPAKMARGLIVRIFDELFAMGALSKGDLVVDPFAGIGSTGIEAASRGVRFVGCELEPRFVDLARQNVARHARDWSAMGRPLPVIVQGDSRRLREAIGPVLSAAAVIASPPYVAIASGAGGLNTQPAKEGQPGGRSASSPSQDTDQRYGDSVGQLARLPAGAVDAVVSSPPFTQGYAGGGGINVKGYGDGADQVGARTYQGTAAAREAGNLESLTLGAVADALVSSPPYENSHNGTDAEFLDHVERTKSGGAPFSGRRTPPSDYGSTEGQIGAEVGETFWSAALEIVRESYAIVRPGGMAVWVVKAFVRNKQIVDFPGDWRTLCEHVGFETVREVQASLVAEERHHDLFDGEIVKKRARKSFFRRLYESKYPGNEIDWEVVYFMRKPSVTR